MSDPIEMADQLQQSGVFKNLSPALQIALFLGALTLVSAALVSITSFTRIVIVFSFVRRALTTQEIPPNSVLIGLALFMTLFVMGPTWEEMSSRAITPFLQERISGAEAYRVASESLKKFMLRQTRRQDLALFLQMSGAARPEEPMDAPLRVVVPAFVISELKTAFLMGFFIYIPFLLVDLVVATVLTSMGMVMMPPVIISTPFKILLFVLVDGWHLVARASNVSFG